jgi:hypothetical protein
MNGLYGKYLVINNLSGEAVKNCFVLRPETDLAALSALKKYARETEDIELSNDLLAWIETIESQAR